MVTNRQARISLTAIFASTGFLVGTWAARIPAAKSAFGLSALGLGLLLACTTVGAVVSSPLAGYASSRFGSRALLRVSAPLAAFTFAFMGLARSAPMLGLALFLMGAANGFVQVSMNTQAIALEGRYKRTILSTMHGGFSIGMMAGALIAALVAYLGVSYHAHLVVVAGLLLVVAVAIGFFLLETDRAARVHHPRIRLSLPLVVIIAVAFFELFCEGTASNWSSVYMSNYVGASGAVAALTFGLYSLTMTVGRFMGDNLVLRLGVGALVRFGGAIAAGGLVLALVFANETMVLIGFAVFGLGLSCQAPTLFRAAGQLPLPEGQGLAAVMAAAWPAFLVVGPLIGGLRQFASYPAALSVTVAAAVMMVALSGLLGRLSPAPVGAIEVAPPLVGANR